MAEPGLRGGLAEPDSNHRGRGGVWATLCCADPPGRARPLPARPYGGARLRCSALSSGSAIWPQAQLAQASAVAADRTAVRIY